MVNFVEMSFYILLIFGVHKLTLCYDAMMISCFVFLEHQQTIHLKCFGVSTELTEGYWSGLEFSNSTTKLIINNAIVLNSSASIMRFVDIEYAGVTPFGDPVPAIKAAPYAPLLFNVTISYSALDGTNFTNLKSWTVVEDSYIHDNRGGCDLSLGNRSGKFGVMLNIVCKSSVACKAKLNIN